MKKVIDVISFPMVLIVIIINTIFAILGAAIIANRYANFDNILILYLPYIVGAMNLILCIYLYLELRGNKHGRNKNN